MKKNMNEAKDVKPPGAKKQPTELTAGDLAAILLKKPDSRVFVAYEEQGAFGTGTPFTDDVVEPVRDVRSTDDGFVFTSSCFLYTGERLWCGEHE